MAYVHRGSTYCSNAQISAINKALMGHKIYGYLFHVRGKNISKLTLYYGSSDITKSSHTRSLLKIDSAISARFPTLDIGLGLWTVRTRTERSFNNTTTHFSHSVVIHPLTLSLYEHLAVRLSHPKIAGTVLNRHFSHLHCIVFRPLCGCLCLCCGGHAANVCRSCGGRCRPPTVALSQYSRR